MSFKDNELDCKNAYVCDGILVREKRSPFLQGKKKKTSINSF